MQFSEAICVDKGRQVVTTLPILLKGMASDADKRRVENLSLHVAESGGGREKCGGSSNLLSPRGHLQGGHSLGEFFSSP
jgi:hypothetical protein